MSAIIEIERTHATASGERFRVWHEGEILVKSCREPLCDGARALVAKGVTGRVQMRRKGSDQIDMQGLIAVLATQTVTEGQSSGPRFTKWFQHWASEAG
ncbi:hypothetical protein [Nitratireductor basaltis]|uniref:Uncharacterized protein n=1 Tax=Nitratireductor basaltis TaxID=472175 RepID=A0A084UDM2_9HYPH|nr:hypothetical protein [Nitratireductor basaltis]KFB11058.1 hypothetical protein EL18_02100 [Nitratireductor basaltis]